MTIASEITRLQNDKAAICTAIENKGVTVGAVTLDSYASCIDAISSGGGKSVCYLMVGGGGGGGGPATNNCGIGGGGGAGGVHIGKFPFISNICVTVGAGGNGGTKGTQGTNGGDSIMVDTDNIECCVVSHGGGGGGAAAQTSACAGKDGGSGGGSGGGCYGVTGCCYMCGGNNIYGTSGEMGSRGGDYMGSCCCLNCLTASGGGGATSSGSGNSQFWFSKNNCPQSPGRGGMGIEGTFGGKTICIAGGGGGGYNNMNASCNRGCGRSGGGRGGYGGSNGSNATTCGSGGGGSGNCCARSGGKGGGGLVIIGYNCVCKDCNGFTCATGGDSCYVCDNIKYHCFTSSGTFTIVS